MAKKVLTPEEYKDKMTKKADRRKRFTKSFLTALAYALACVIVFAMVTIAFTKPATQVVQTNSNNTSVNTNTNNDSTPVDQPSDTPADTPADQPSDTPADTPADQPSDKPADNNGGSNAQAPAATDETQKAVDLYKTAYNKAKSSAKTITHTKTGATNYKGIVEAGGLSSAAQTLMGMFMKESEPNEVIDKSELPPKTGVNNLTKNSVASATIKEQGNTQVVTLKLKDAVNPKAGSDGIGSTVNVIEESQITGSISSVPGLKLSDIKVAYENVTVTAKIDKATGNMTYLYLDAPCVLSLNAKLLVTSVDNARVGIQCTDEYVFAW